MAHYEFDEKGNKFIRPDKGDHIRMFGVNGCVVVPDETWSKLKSKLDETKAIIESELKPEQIAQLDMI